VGGWLCCVLCVCVCERDTEMCIFSSNVSYVYSISLPLCLIRKRKLPSIARVAYTDIPAYIHAHAYRERKRKRKREI
jgi:hypothetical protein